MYTAWRRFAEETHEVEVEEEGAGGYEFRSEGEVVFEIAEHDYFVLAAGSGVDRVGEAGDVAVLQDCSGDQGEEGGR